MGLFFPAPVSVNVGAAKKISLREKGQLGDPKQIFGAWNSSEDL